MLCKFVFVDVGAARAAVHVVAAGPSVAARFLAGRLGVHENVEVSNEDL